VPPRSFKPLVLAHEVDARLSEPSDNDMTWLEPGFAITPEHLEEAARAARIEVGPGDAVLVRTGWAPLWTADPGRPYVVHRHLLAETARYILENVTLDELAAAGATEFLFALSTPRTCGSTGGMASPPAIV